MLRSSVRWVRLDELGLVVATFLVQLRVSARYFGAVLVEEEVGRANAADP